MPRRGIPDERGLGPRGPQSQHAIAVWAAVPGEPISAVGAPRALERTDPHVQCVRRQVSITALAVGSDLQHRRLRSVARAAQDARFVHRARAERTDGKI